MNRIRAIPAVFRGIGATGVLASALFAAVPAGAEVLSADDLCDPADDPCIVDGNVFVGPDGAPASVVLDFGARVLRLEGGGTLDIGANSVEIRCGGFDVSVGDRLAIDARGSDGSGPIGGDLRVEVRRRCSANADVPCLVDTDCDLGSCAATACAGDTDQTCESDGDCSFGRCLTASCFFRPSLECTLDDDCNIGPCDLPSRTCNGDPSVRCANNGQCDFGTCVGDDRTCGGNPAVVCAGDADCETGPCTAAVCERPDGGGNRTCTNDSDCFEGVCSDGGGSAILNGRFRANTDLPGSLTIIAAGDISVEQPVTVAAGGSANDGGSVVLQSRSGNVVIDAAIAAGSGANGEGGSVELDASGDITVGATVTVDGGSGGGGSFDAVAGGRISIDKRIDADSKIGGGDGGFISLEADGDIVLAGGGQLTSSASIDQSGGGLAGGQGGIQEHRAGGSVMVLDGSLLRAAGERPDGAAGEVEIFASENIAIGGTININGLGIDSFGGFFRADAEGMLSVSAGANLTATGGSGEGASGEIRLHGRMLLEMDGNLDNRAGVPLGAQGIFLSGDGELDLSGNVNSSDATGIDIEACFITVEDGAKITGKDSHNLIKSRETATIEFGAKILATGENGRNEVRYRDATTPPFIGFASTDPQAIRILDESLDPCPVCGNGEVEDGEVCDDGNLDDGDGCNGSCRDEQCPDDPDGCPPATTTTMVVTTTTVVVPICGNGVEEGPETCDDGDTEWLPGRYCLGDCRRVSCGDTNGSFTLSASDALFILRVAVGSTSCDACVCNVDGSGGGFPVTAVDALLALRSAVGDTSVVLSCPAACP